jgi:hypothetical protein
MTLEKILYVAQNHNRALDENGVPILPMADHLYYSTDPEVARKQLLGHARYLFAESIPKLIQEARHITDPAALAERHGKIGRHLGSAQTLLWCAGWHTLRDLKDINRPDSLSQSF